MTLHGERPQLLAERATLPKTYDPITEIQIEREDHLVSGP